MVLLSDKKDPALVDRRTCRINSHGSNPACFWCISGLRICRERNGVLFKAIFHSDEPSGTNVAEKGAGAVLARLTGRNLTNPERMPRTVFCPVPGVVFNKTDENPWSLLAIRCAAIKIISGK
jgi:hypothetical protein